MKNFIRESICAVMKSSEIEGMNLLSDLPFVVESPKQRSQGDFSTNIALVGAKHLKMSPKELANELIPILDNLDLFDKIEVS